jgi:16S rRNA (guanine527-N7)-methyltransferase
MSEEEYLLRQGLSTLCIDMNDRGIDKLLAFTSLIEKWNKSYNLTAICQREDMVKLHLLDSLAIVNHLQGKNIADIGTGAGLPGIPLAICRPDLSFFLVDSNAKKTRFVQQVLLELQLENVVVMHSRVENFQPAHLFDSVLTRAFASLPVIIQLTQHLLSQNGLLLAMKADVSPEELSEVVFSSVEPIHVPFVDAKRCLVKIKIS